MMQTGLSLFLHSFDRNTADNSLDRCSNRGIAKCLWSCLAVALIVIISWPSGQAMAQQSKLGDYLSARVADNQGDYAKAAKFYKKVINHGKPTPALAARALTIFIMAGKIDWSKPIADELIKDLPNNQTVQLAKISFLVANGENDQAGEMLKNPQNSGIAAFTTPLFQAWLLAANGKTDAAIKALKPLDLQGTKGIYNRQQGLINEMAGRFDKAAENFRALGWPNGILSPRVSRDLIRVDVKAGNIKEAQAVLKAAIINQPDTRFYKDLEAVIEGRQKAKNGITSAKQGFAMSLFGIARVMEQQRATQLPRLLSQLAFYLNPDLAANRILLSGLHNVKIEPDASLQLLKDIPSTSPYIWQANLELALLMDRTGYSDQAETLLLNLLSDNPKWIRPALLLGNIRRAREQDIKAIKAYDLAMERVGEPTKAYWRVLYSRGISLERSGQWPKAEKDLLKALSLQPNAPFVLNYLGYSWVDKGINLNKAITMIEKAVRLRPRDGYIADSLGWGYYKLKRYDEAVTELEKAIELQPADPVINDHLGDAYWQVGRSIEARFQWNRSLLMKPDAKLEKKIRLKLENGLTDPVLPANAVNTPANPDNG